MCFQNETVSARLRRPLAAAALLALFSAARYDPARRVEFFQWRSR